MKNILIVSVLLLLISGTALAGVGYDQCRHQEKLLKAQAVSDCKGLRYLFDPSACFATQKALKEYTSGKCKKIGIDEHVDFSVQPVIPKKTTLSEPAPLQKKIEPSAAPQTTTLEQLKEENLHLRAEVIRLKAENEQLRKLVR
ncbi:MAG: hypothetical protein M0T70_00520 [Geobacteraceae bacterium]|nr:hypothetical protein [Geobacteraceae bacterium]